VNPRRRAVLPLLVALGLLLGAAAAAWWQPGCPIRSGLGVKCPGCGAGRSLAALLAGEWRGAFYWNAMLWPMLLLLVGAGFQRPWGWKGWVALGLLGMGFGVARNLPFYLLY